MAIRDEAYINTIKGLLIELFELRSKMDNPKAVAFELTAFDRRILEIETSLTAYERYEVEALTECLQKTIDCEKLANILHGGKTFSDRKLTAMNKFINKPNYTTWFDDFVNELIKLIIASGRSFKDGMDYDDALETIFYITIRKEKSNDRFTSTQL